MGLDEGLERLESTRQCVLQLIAARESGVVVEESGTDGSSYSLIHNLPRY